MTTQHTALPVTVSIEPGEDIAAYLERVAAANRLSMTDLTGHPRTARLWEDPPDDLLTRLSASTGVPVPRMRDAVLRTALPGAVPERARTGRRYAGRPATCPAGCVDTVAARLNIVVLCLRCGALLVDHDDSHPPPVPDKVRQIHPDVLDSLARARRSSQARGRLRRVESLMAELEPALWGNWPPLADGETTHWRDRIVRWEKWNLEQTGGVIRPPSVTATLLALTWDASATPAGTTDLLDEIAVMADPWDPSEEVLPGWRTLTEAHDGVLDLLDDQQIEPRHIPTILRLTGEPIVLPEHQRTLWVAEALALTILAGRAHGQDLTLNTAVELHGAAASARTRRVVHRVLRSTYALERLAVHATLLHEQGLRDLRRARAELRHLRALPSDALRTLPTAAGGHVDPEQCAAWVWLDATLGRPAGGPHPLPAAEAMVRFDAHLDPETKLHLRAWWQHRLDLAEDLATADAPTQESSTEMGGRDVG